MGMEDEKPLDGADILIFFPSSESTKSISIDDHRLLLLLDGKNSLYEKIHTHSCVFCPDN
jgi:hypothetical protein